MRSVRGWRSSTAGAAPASDTAGAAPAPDLDLIVLIDDEAAREVDEGDRVAREAGGIPPRLAEEPQRLGGVPAGEQEAGQIRSGQERLGVARPPQAPLLAEDGPRQLQRVRRPALEARSWA